MSAWPSMKGWLPRGPRPHGQDSCLAVASSGPCAHGGTTLGWRLPQLLREDVSWWGAGLLQEWERSGQAGWEQWGPRPGPGDPQAPIPHVPRGSRAKACGHRPVTGSRALPALKEGGEKRGLGRRGRRAGEGRGKRDTEMSRGSTRSRGVSSKGETRRKAGRWPLRRS